VLPVREEIYCGNVLQLRIEGDTFFWFDKVKTAYVIHSGVVGRLRSVDSSMGFQDEIYRTEYMEIERFRFMAKSV
jgi:hypothetical protein